MGWVRISDDFYDNEKIVAAGPHAMAVWVAAMAWCNRNLTDGLIPRPRARTLLDFTGHAILLNNFGGDDGDACSDYAIASLVDYGLLHEPGHKCRDCPQPKPNGLVIHDYLKYQFSRAQIEEKAAASKQRVDAWREKRKQERNGECNSVTSAYIQRTNAVVTPDVTRQPNPNPNPKSFTSNEVKEGGGEVGRERHQGATPEPPPCKKHPEGNAESPCAACGRRRKWLEAQEAAKAADELEAKRAERERAKNCPHCGGTNLIDLDDNKVRKCNHDGVMSSA